MKQTCQTRPARGESRKKKLRRKRAAQALAAGVAIAGGTQVYAVEVMFPNPPGAEHFDWSAPTDLGLDVTLPASGQPADENGPSRFFQEIRPDHSLVQSQGMLEIGGAYGLFLLGVDAGEVIPSGAAFGTVGYVYYSGFGSELPEGQPTYLGIKFDLGSGDQYGWIGVVRDYMELDAFAWGYETDPGLPIGAGVPEPGTQAMLAVGAAAMAGRRRRPA